MLSIYPRFGRRSGGAIVTVRGENFGLTGSRPILRVAGRKSPRCWYPPTEFVPGAPVGNGSLSSHCTNGLLDGGEDKPDCGGPDCPPCVAGLLPLHCSNGALDVALGEVLVGKVVFSNGFTQDCGGSCLGSQVRLSVKPSQGGLARVYKGHRPNPRTGR